MKTAVLFLNLGGPDSFSAIQPFLFNLFYDPAIIALPNPLRWGVAQLISRLRVAKATQIYDAIGGRSPLLPNTQAQARALEQILPESYRVWPVMRYWHPRAQDVLKEVTAWGAEEIVLLPLYPQFSTVTTASSFQEINNEIKRLNINTKVRSICCYPTASGWIGYWQQEILRAVKKIKGPMRVLFSAHGVLAETIRRGDPYQAQVEKTVQAVLAGLPALDACITYQSRVGPRTWLGPDTEAEIRRAGGEGVSVVVVPISFVSEHSETLYELDIQYKNLAQEVGVPNYMRVRTPGVDRRFIAELKELILGDAGGDGCPGLCRLCPRHLENTRVEHLPPFRPRE